MARLRRERNGIRCTELRHIEHFHYHFCQNDDAKKKFCKVRSISPIDVEVMRGGGGDDDIGHVTAETNVETAFYIAPDHFMPRIKSQIISF